MNRETGARNYALKPLCWERSDKRFLGYSVDAILVKDEEAGGYVSSIAQLPGVFSEGDDAASAIQNLIEALGATIESYRKEGMPIPWRNPGPKEPNEDRFRIVVSCQNCP